MPSCGSLFGLAAAIVDDRAPHEGDIVVEGKRGLDTFASQPGFHAADCLAATSPEEHQNAITYDYPMFSKPISAEELLQELG